MLFPLLREPPDRLALAVSEASLTWRALAGRLGAHVHALRTHGIGPGARVGVWTQAHLDTAVAMVGNLVAGVVSVPLDVKLGAGELAHIAGDARPVVALAADPGAIGERPGVSFPTVGVARDERPLSELAEDPSRPALVLYTSGTTGPPKGAVLTAAGVAANLAALRAVWDWTERDVVVHALPLFHVHGLVLGLFGSLAAGGALKWVPRFEPAALAGALTPGAVLFAVPTMYHRLAEAAEADPSVHAALARTRLAVSGSAALPSRDRLRMERVLGRGLVERYGLTETLIVSSTRPGSPPGSAGPPLPSVEVQLVDDAGEVVREDARMGEVWVRGPSVFAGYLDRPDATRAAMHGDWFRTGDLATWRNGALQLVGRTSTDLIKCGGFKVGAGEVEAALLEHPAVAEAAVVGVADEDLGERIVAHVVARSSVAPEALIDFVAGLLSPHKRPREVRLVSQLPRNAMGKVKKSELKRE